ncbi:hypothetical protein SAMN02787076_03537 [Rhizobacter sp. OV335]|nr:hypothetical protein SAMN02787076_03537 [Rhizobacter sp. OV335]
MSLQTSIQFDGEGNEIDLQRAQPGAQLDHVDPAFTALDLADRCLATAEPLRQVGLTQPDRLAIASQELQEDLLMTAV